MSRLHVAVKMYNIIKYSFYRAMHYSAKRGLAILSSVCLSACPSVCDAGGSGSHTRRLEILETNGTDN